MIARYELRCSTCNAPAQRHDLPCVACGELLEFALQADAPDAPAAREYAAMVARRRASNDPLDRSGIWRWRELLPPIPHASVVTLAEGNVPLYDVPEIAARERIAALAFLHLGMNPTGSFKDLGMTVAISAARAEGATRAICASTGNTASSMAAYAARAGMEAYALVPRGKISGAKLAQMRDYGVRVVEVEGSFDDALAELTSRSGDGAAVVNSINPYRLEGQKCTAFAILEARSWRVPDWVVVPGGNLGNSSAIGKGFREARALGLIDRLPRIAVVQAEGAAPFVELYRSGADLVPLLPHTIASAIAVGAPRSWRKARAELDASQGAAIAVSDDEIDEAKGRIGAAGIGCEPASAATLAGIVRLRAEGTIGEHDDIVAVLTGHVLKDSDASLRVADRRDADA
uniref:Threonine synthase n=1 Tax=mine drainage metagenome TaxID=410659 RepID=E6PHN8_9ZZZZ